MKNDKEKNLYLEKFLIDNLLVDILISQSRVVLYILWTISWELGRGQIRQLTGLHPK